MKSLSVKLGVVLIGLFILTYAEVWGEDWKLYGSNDRVFGYYDTQSITRPSQNVVIVWTRWDYKGKGVLFMVGKFGKEYENLSYSKQFLEINCSERKNRGLSLINHDNKGNVIESTSSPSDWNYVTPGSLGESLYKEVCK